MTIPAIPAPPRSNNNVVVDITRLRNAPSQKYSENYSAKMPRFKSLRAKSVIVSRAKVSVVMCRSRSKIEIKGNFNIVTGRLESAIF